MDLLIVWDSWGWDGYFWSSGGGGLYGRLVDLFFIYLVDGLLWSEDEDF